MALTAKERDEIIEQVYEEIITVLNLPVNLYDDYTDGFDGIIDEAYGGLPGDFDINSPREKLAVRLQNNTWRFSGAKTFQQIFTMEDVLYDGSGMIKPFTQFYTEAREVYDIHNIAWLRAEYDIADKMCMGADEWLDYEEEAEALPYI